MPGSYSFGIFLSIPLVEAGYIYWNYYDAIYVVRQGDRLIDFQQTALSISRYTVSLFINYHKFYRKQYPLPPVSRLASRGEQWLRVCNIYANRSQERLEKKSSEINKTNKKK